MTEIRCDQRKCDVSERTMEHTTESVSSATSSDLTSTTTWSSNVELCVVVVLLLVFCVLGVAGNVVVLAVFCRCGDQLASTVFILVLAAVDFTTCLAVVPFTIYIELVHYNVGVDFVCKLYQVCRLSHLHTGNKFSPVAETSFLAEPCNVW